MSFIITTYQNALSQHFSEFICMIISDTKNAAANAPVAVIYHSAIISVILQGIDE